MANVVARVGDRAIGADEIAARMSLDGVDADAALASLIEEELLAQEAERLGVRQGPEAERAVERVMVRAMLNDIEAELTPEAVPMEEVRNDFAEHREKFQVPERRASWHILVEDASDEGRNAALSILAEVVRADDPETVFERFSRGDGDAGGLPTKAERIPAITRKAGIEKPYKDALFAREEVGPLENVVGTSYGWHVIVLTEIVPGERRALDDVEDEIRERLSHKKRFEQVAAIVERLESEGLVEVDERGVKRLLSMSGLPERAP